MTILESLLLGLVQGVTEFLPVSSSGHLVVMRGFLDITPPPIVFDLWLHLATTAAAVVFFWRQIRQLTLKQIMIIAAANIPVAVLGLGFGDQVEKLFGSLLVVSFTLMITGVLNIFSDMILQRRNSTQQHGQDTFPSFGQGLAVGLAQMIALIPGISRSGSTVFAGLKMGLSRESAFSFSFLLVMPAIVGATLIKSLDVSLLGSMQTMFPMYFVGCLTAFVAGFYSLRLLKKLLVSAQLRYFGAYCLVLGGGLFVSQLMGLL